MNDILSTVFACAAAPLLLALLVLLVRLMWGLIRDVDEPYTRRDSDGGTWEKRWPLQHSAEWDGEQRPCSILRADLPCGGCLYGRFFHFDLEDGAGCAELQKAVERGGVLLECPKADAVERVHCPAFEAFLDGRWNAAAVVDAHERAGADGAPGGVARKKQDAFKVEWRLTSVPYHKLPPLARPAPILEPHLERCLSGFRKTRILFDPSRALRAFLAERRPKCEDCGDGGDDGRGGGDCGCGEHGAESTTGASPAQRRATR